jgi:integrase
MARRSRARCFPVIGKVAVDKVGVREVLAAIEPHWVSKHETASRNRGRVEKVLDYAKAMRHRTGDINPASWKGNLSAVLAAPKSVRVKTHLEAMDFTAVPAFVAQLREGADRAAVALEFLILTASRSAEVRDAQWSEIDIESKLWTIPKDRMKAGREHLVPLTDRAVDILKHLDRKGSDVFDIRRDDMIDLTKSLAGSATVHGFRAAFSIWAGEKTAFPRDIVERCIAHATGSAVEQAYRRGAELDRRRAVPSRRLDASAHADASRFILTSLARRYCGGVAVGSGERDYPGSQDATRCTKVLEKGETTDTLGVRLHVRKARLSVYRAQVQRGAWSFLVDGQAVGPRWQGQVDFADATGAPTRRPRRFLCSAVAAGAMTINVADGICCVPT